MNRIRIVFCTVLALFATSSVDAQVTASGGTANAIAKFSGPSTLVSSAVTEVSGNVGIGTSTPGATLDVVGSARFRAGAGATFGSGTGTATGEAYLFSTSLPGQNAGITVNRGNTSAYASLDLVSGANYSSGWSIQMQPSLTELDFVDRSHNGPALMFLRPGLLGVDGSIALTLGSGASLTFQDGSVQSTAWNGTVLGGDYAESVDVLGDRASYEIGDVIAIDPDQSGVFAKAHEPYSRFVAGVYSTKPGLVGRRIGVARTDKDAEVPMAMVGIVPTKVCDENGPIRRGDLLVSASKAGYAMHGTQGSKLTGAIIGKALGPLDTGTGVIEVLLSVQ